MLDADMLRIAFAAAAAAGVCFFAAMTGSGSGLIMVPLLTFLGLPMVEAIAIHKFESTLWTTISASRYLRRQQVLFLDFPAYLVLGCIGTFFGAELIHFISDDLLKSVVGTAILVVGFWIVFFHRDPQPMEIVPWKRGLLIGSMFFFGLYEGTFGSGNGYFIAALFFSLIGSDVLKTIGMITVLAAVWNLVAVATHYSLGSLHFQYAIPVGIGSSIGAWFGAGFGIAKGAKFVRWVMVGGAFIAGALILVS
ncbi:MAG TPA: sulfite exporter TauE/SafE family protein [Leptolyngbyaceae cyanobacterium]